MGVEGRERDGLRQSEVWKGQKEIDGERGVWEVLQCWPLDCKQALLGETANFFKQYHNQTTISPRPCPP